MAPMLLTTVERDAWLVAHPDWTWDPLRRAIHKVYRFRDFVAAARTAMGVTRSVTA